MDNLVHFEVLSNGRGGHEDLVFQVFGLTELLIFDTYYFALAEEQMNDLNDVRVTIARYLSLWVKEVEEMVVGEHRVFPIDISDQYTGCLKVTYLGQCVVLEYGFSVMTEGHGIDLLEPQSYFTGILDFRTTTATLLETDRGMFIRSLMGEIESLKQNSVRSANDH